MEQWWWLLIGYTREKMRCSLSLSLSHTDTHTEDTQKLLKFSQSLVFFKTYCVTRDLSLQCTDSFTVVGELQ